MLSGKYWITPRGVIDVSHSEHALVAKNRMLRLQPPDELPLDKSLILPLAARDVARHKRRGVGRRPLSWLAEGCDPRVYAIRYWGWVRTRGGAFWLWTLDRRTHLMLRNADAYWSAQRAEASDVIEVIQLREDTELMLPIAALRATVK